MAVATVEGVSVLVKICDDGGTPALILGQDDATLEITTDMIDVTVKATADNAKEFLAGRYTWTIKASGLLKAGGTGGLADVVNAQITKAKQDVQMLLGDDTFSGEAYIERSSGGGPDNDKGVFSIDFRGTGSLTLPAYAT